MHPRLAGDSLPIGQSHWSVVRLFDDARWPWLLLVPRLAAGTEPVSELHQLGPQIRAGFLEDINRSSAIIAEITRADSVNIGMLGNVVADLHCHVVARFVDDPAWPAPVWGFDTRRPYEPQERPQELIRAVVDGLQLSD